MASKVTNRLVYEKSPYLLQHAENPVDWYPWGDEAFEKARQENKPIFLSIGYSTCHWCHVMAHESFEDSEVARLMNAAFISIKVDREERPDIDMVYMTVSQTMTGSGGWPLSIIMTPDKQPFFAATYIPKETRFGRIGLLELIPRIQQLWSQRQSEALNSARQITEAIRKTISAEAGEPLAEPVLHRAYEQLQALFDAQNGGFGGAPKFPTPHNILFLLRYWKRTGDGQALAMAESVLQAMRRGGIYDHVGFGFHRYSTDSRWLVPHFEKMLYDQALLAMAYTEAYQATGREEYSQTAREIFSYILRDMTAPEGGFYSAEDADSEGEEGKFYLWTRDEIQSVLSGEETDLAVRVFNISEDGNFVEEAAGGKSSRNILHLTRSIDQLASDLNISAPALRASIEKIRRKLFAYREQRLRPYKDDKILTDWNGLMIAALAKGARVLGESRYADAAKRAGEFIMAELRTKDGRLLHRYRDGQAAVPANLDDYAFFVYGMLELYETTFDANYLRTALEINEDLIAHFWDDADGGFYFSASDGESLLVRQKEIYDGAIPSGNSIAMLNLLRLGRITADPELEKKSSRIGEVFSEAVKESPGAYTQLMVAVDFATGPAHEVVITGDSRREDTREMLAAIHGHFIPNKVVILRPTDDLSHLIDDIVPYTRYHAAGNGQATAYVCLDYKCQYPTTEVSKMLELLGSGHSSNTNL